MKIQSLVLFFNLLIVTTLFAQKEGNIWYFGKGSGLDFNGGTPVKLTNGQLSTFEGCASICDASGALLFYTDGSYIYNKNHQLMFNGDSLLGDNSSTQSAIIVKKPRSNSLYYVFTVDDAGGQDGLRYSIVDMSLQNGLGAVTSKKNVSVLLQCCEKIAAVRHQNNYDFWIIAHHFGSNKFYSFLLTSNGIDIDHPVISPSGSYLNNNLLNTLGYLKVSPDGSRISNANYFKGSFDIFDFNKTTGKLNNPMIFYPDSIASPYGTEFSPNSKLVYVSDYKSGKVYQYDLSSNIYSVINQSKTMINSVSGPSVNGALQLAPDNKIYYAMNGENHLSVINNPNSCGINCDFDSQGLSLGYTSSGIGLPTFYNSIFKPKKFSYQNTCLGDSTVFSVFDWNFDSLLWNFGDYESDTNNYSTLVQPKHVFSSAGKYTVSLKLYSNGVMDTIISRVNIDPIISEVLGNDTTICTNQGLILSVNNPYEYCLWSNFSTSSFIHISKEGDYWVTIKTKCSTETDTITVSVIDCRPDLLMPNIITPNGDGINDYFIPFKKFGIVDENLQIFNRWGKEIYENNFLNPWEGSKNGTPCAEGVYFWVMRFKDYNGNDFIQKGSLTLMR